MNALETVGLCTGIAFLVLLTWWWSIRLMVRYELEQRRKAHTPLVVEEPGAIVATALLIAVFFPVSLPVVVIWERIIARTTGRSGSEVLIAFSKVSK